MTTRMPRLARRWTTSTTPSSKNWASSIPTTRVSLRTRSASSRESRTATASMLASEWLTILVAW